MKYINDIDVQNKRVILRLDLNVPIKNGIILDETKIKKSVKTIEYLLSSGAHVLIMSHLGKVKSEEDKKKTSLLMVRDALKKYLNQDILFINDVKSDLLKDILKDNKLVMMENTRFADYPDKLESNCSDELSKFWASAADLFINDAFASTHRKHASTYGISKYIPSAYGFLVKEELEGLNPIVNDIKRPFTIVMGGAKADDKIVVIEKLLENADCILLGGGLANTFLLASGNDIGSSLYSEKSLETAIDLYKKYTNKIYVPVDAYTLNGSIVRCTDIDGVKNDEKILDIGPKTIRLYEGIIKGSNTIFLNGTMGLYEEKDFETGTKSILEIITNSNAKKVAGGGDALASINKFGLEESFDYMSTGGGATLEYIAYKKVNCFEEDRNANIES